MTSQHDPDRLIRSYLEDGPSELPRDSYEALDERITRTRQRAGVGPWRDPRMLTLSRAVIGVAAVLTAAIVFLVVGSPGRLGPGGSAPPASSPASSPTPVASPLAYRWIETLQPGTYATSLSWDDSLVFTFTVGQGWESRDINIVQGGHVSLGFYPIENVATDPCTRTLGAPPLSADDVFAAIGRVATIDAARQATRLRIGDRDATSIEFTIDPPEACAAAAYGLIKLPAQTCRPGVCGGLGGEWYGLEFGAVRHHERLWIMDIGRRLVAINPVWTDAATPDERAALQAVMDSVRLDTPLATAAPSPAG
jgi:hypothetical protein